MTKEKISGWKRSYLVLRWPAVLGVLGLAGIFFFVGLLSSLGYNGTTPRRPANKNSPEWINFINSSVPPGTDPERGKPFRWKASQPSITGDLVNFDKRLLSVFEYLKSGSVNQDANACGWDSSHERLVVDVDSASVFSTYSVPPSKATPLSTVERGVGVRLHEADYIKCTIHPRSPSSTCSAPSPTKWKKFGIPLSTDLINPTEPYDTNCQVTCAVDYYPLVADPVESKKPQYNSAITELAKFNPSAEVFDYESITKYSRKAAILKNILLAFELMLIDEPGCQAASGNRGYLRLIPNALIIPEWVKSQLGDDWQSLVDVAEIEFPFHFQSSSKLAGLAPEKVLNILGIHFNF